MTYSLFTRLHLAGGSLGQMIVLRFAERSVRQMHWP
jgi:hypothetical protein